MTTYTETAAARNNGSMALCSKPAGVHNAGLVTKDCARGHQFLDMPLTHESRRWASGSRSVGRCFGLIGVTCFTSSVESLPAHHRRRPASRGSHISMHYFTTTNTTAADRCTRRAGSIEDGKEEAAAAAAASAGKLIAAGTDVRTL